MSLVDYLTDPRNHNENNFIYLVHGINYDKTANEIEQILSRINTPGCFYSASLIGKLSKDKALRLLDYPHEINQTYTFGLIGFIVQPEKDEDIYIAWNCDIGSPLEPSELKEFARKHRGKKKSIVKLLTNAVGIKYIRYNELILQGSEDTKISGIFYREGLNEIGKEKLSLLTEVIEDFTKSKIPIVALPPFNYQHQTLREILANETPRYISLYNMIEALDEFYGIHI